MAAFTSIASGNWDDGPTTWGTGAGVYPGSVGAQADTVVVANTHVVSLNLTTFAGTVTTVTVNSGGKLTIDAQFNTDAKFTGNWSVTGEVEFKKTAGTYELRIQGEFSVKSGGTLDMDASAAGVYQKLSFDSSAAGQSCLDPESGSTIVLKGATKTVATQLNGARTAGQNYIIVDLDTGWVVGDRIVLVDTGIEVVTLSVNNGGGNWTISGVLAANHADNVEAWSLTRSCQVYNTDATNKGYCNFLTGSTLTVEYAEFYDFRYVTFGGANHVVSYCGIQPAAGGWYYGLGLTNFAQADHCIIYASSMVNGGLSLATGAKATTCYVCATATDLHQHVEGTDGTLIDCRFGRGNSVAHWGQAAVRMVFLGGYAWGVSNCATYNNNDIWFRGMVFNQDPGGNNYTAMTMARSTHGLIMYDDCGPTLGAPSGSPDTVLGRLISLNHNNQSGYYKEWQLYGLIESNAAQARGGTGYCISIDPSSTSFPARYYITFPCTSGKTPTLTFWAKGANTLGVLSVIRGRHAAGLTAIASGTPFTVTTAYAQKSVTFTGTTDCNGQVEVIIEVLDSSSGILYIDDIAVSGNL